MDDKLFDSLSLITWYKDDLHKILDLKKLGMISENCKMMIVLKFIGTGSPKMILWQEANI